MARFNLDMFCEIGLDETTTGFVSICHLLISAGVAGYLEEEEEEVGPGEGLGRRLKQ